MKRFPLATVLRIRRIQEDVARTGVATAQAETHRAASEHARREAVLAQRPEPGSAEAAQWLAMRAAALSLAGDVVAARHLVAAREDEAAHARDRLGRATMAREGIESLAERHADEVRRELADAEQRASDDRAGAAHRARHAAPRPGADA